MRESRTYGSVRGAPSNGRPYRDRACAVPAIKGLRRARFVPVFAGDKLCPPYAVPHTSCAVSTISRSFAICCSAVIVLPPMPLSNPHCGLIASCSIGA